MPRFVRVLPMILPERSGSNNFLGRSRYTSLYQVRKKCVGERRRENGNETMPVVCVHCVPRFSRLCLWAEHWAICGLVLWIMQCRHWLRSHRQSLTGPSQYNHTIHLRNSTVW
jgi:hypothetical protein